MFIIPVQSCPVPLPPPYARVLSERLQKLSTSRDQLIHLSSLYDAQRSAFASSASSSKTLNSHSYIPATPSSTPAPINPSDAMDIQSSSTLALMSDLHLDDRKEEEEEEPAEPSPPGSARGRGEVPPNLKFTFNLIDPSSIVLGGCSDVKADYLPPKFNKAFMVCSDVLFRYNITLLYNLYSLINIYLPCRNG